MVHTNKIIYTITETRKVKKFFCFNFEKYPYFHVEIDCENDLFLVGLKIINSMLND
jgi:hypothetical protein